MSKILVTGAGGMLAHDVLAEIKVRGHEAVPADRNLLDVTDTKACQELIDSLQPDAVIHCAAWTNVDGAQSDPYGAYRGNALGGWNLASACAINKIWMAYVSTDFVFDGEKGSPYDEFDLPNPVSVYGRTKEVGERLVRHTLPDRHLIARTSFLYGTQGKNIIKSIAKFAQSKPELTFVTDQIICPTHTRDLSRVLLDLIEDPLPGTYHVASSGKCSLFELAEAVISELGLSAVVLPTTLAEFVEKFNPPALRPRYSALHRRALAMRGMDTMPDWRMALGEYLALPGAIE